MDGQKLWKNYILKLKKKNSFSATFHCVLALKSENSEISIFKGEVNGKIVWPPRGENGFGYDPFFIPWNSKKTFGEMFHKKKKFYKITGLKPLKKWLNFI